MTCLAYRMAAAFGVLCLASWSPAEAQRNTNPWALMAQRDLNAIHDIIRDNHPGPVDPQNPHYRVWLEGGLAKATARAKAARSYSDYFRVLRYYTNGFEDGHIELDFDFGPTTTDWTGFVIGSGSSGEPQVISAEADSGVKVGDRVESCDGKPFEALMKSRVDPYFVNGAIPQSEGTWRSELFIASPDELATRLKQCRFSSGEVKLNWRSLPTNEVNKKLQAAFNFEGSDFSLKQVDGVWFVRLPRFWFNSDDEMKKMQALLDEVKAKAPELRKGTVVFDVRGNGGGDSSWGYRIATALWGEKWADRVESSFDQSHDVRVSPANMRKVSENLEYVKDHNETDALPYWNLVEAAMKKARAHHQQLAHVNIPPTPPTEPAPADPVTGRVFFLTDPICGSACLSFADLVLHLPGVTQIGGPTFADAVYIDINALPLPSGLAKFEYGMKVMRGGPRGNNQWYEPRYRWPGGPMTDETIARWVKSLPKGHETSTPTIKGIRP
jgi:hypothetical protein